MKLAIKPEELFEAEHGIQQEAPQPRRKLRIWSVWTILVVGVFLNLAAFINLRFAENAIDDMEINSKSASELKSTSWATLLAGATFTVFISVYVLALLRQLDTFRDAVGGRAKELQFATEQRMKMEAELARTKVDFDRRVTERTRELADSNKFMLSEIGERKRAEAELAAEKERLITTLRSIGDGVIATDSDSRIVLMNRVAEELTGYKQEETSRKFLYEVFKVLEADTGQPFTQLLERVVASGTQPEFTEELVLVGKDGKERHIAHSSAPIYDPDGHINGIVIAFRDISEKRRAEEERTKAHKLESIGLLAGGIAHDYNNLLTAILGNLSLAQMSVSENPMEVPALLNEVEGASLRAKALTHQLLTFAKGGAPIKQKASLTEMVKDSAEFVMRGSNSKCEFDLAPDTMPSEVDLGQISQVVQNIVINADQAMPVGGKIVIRSENVNFIERQKNLPLRPGRYIKISITDNGPGIPKEILDRIFEPYFTTKEMGSGLGLTTSFAIVKKHDGYLNVESTPGKGTSFSIYLPAAEAENGQTLGKAQPLVLRGNGKNPRHGRRRIHTQSRQAHAGKRGLQGHHGGRRPGRADGVQGVH